MARILRRPQVEQLTGLGRSAIYERMHRGQFPRQVHLDGKAVGWVQEEIAAWVEARIAERDDAAV